MFLSFSVMTCCDCNSAGEAETFVMHEKYFLVVRNGLGSGIFLFLMFALLFGFWFPVYMHVTLDSE